jgi:putative ABC transport system substrate-binding protein
MALAAVALGVPLAAIAQRQPGKVPRVAYLSGRSGLPDPSLDAVRQGLRELGYVEGKSIQFEYHYFGDRMDQIPGALAELVQRVDVLVSATYSVILAARQASKTVPIVALVNQDPVATGLVASLARPGGNITGISRLIGELSGKRLELLKELVPGVARVAVLWDADEKPSADGYQEYAAAARLLKVELLSLTVRSPKPDLEGAFQAAVKARAGALITIRNPLILGHARRIADLAVKHRLPSMFEGMEFIEAGGLISYSPDDYESFRRTAVFVDKILKGAKPGDLPIEQPTKFELVINMKTAKSLGIKVPQTLLLQATRVIE